MAVSLINGEHHKSPSGCHNKVKWILSQCGHDREAVEDFFSRFRNGKLLRIENEASHESWNYAFWIANWWVHKKLGHFPPSVLDKYHWLRAEYDMRRGLYGKAHDVHRDTAARMLHKKPEDVTDAERRLAKTINFGVMFGGFRDV